MKKEFVPYEVALRLKELGFNEPCFAQYRKYDMGEATLDIGFSKNEITMQFHKLSKFCSVPTFSQAFRFFRDNYGLYHQINSYYNGGRITRIMVFIHDVYEDTCYDDLSNILYLTYEEAELACLEKLLEIVESKSK